MHISVNLYWSSLNSNIRIYPHQFHVSKRYTDTGIMQTEFIIMKLFHYVSILQFWTSFLLYLHTRARAHQTWAHRTKAIHYSQYPDKSPSVLAYWISDHESVILRMSDWKQALHTLKRLKNMFNPHFFFFFFFFLWYLSGASRCLITSNGSMGLKVKSGGQHSRLEGCWIWRGEANTAVCLVLKCKKEANPSWMMLNMTQRGKHCHLLWSWVWPRETNTSFLCCDV